ncbi:FmdB family zinc ribbon protein [Agromyces aerolatus]|uniref:FmdB family zinc ribbon protein n=1 Tax=Agromyces sp. LY-1074 TaxID=3074080 RepID=UPI002862FD09|nr:MULTISPECIES: FmdB family zinc ribbon protein [unclassified Agromyces]MDR5699783.1 zinc ribbon domain-containing protein [Agromyces sp. LY-1074]MDR5706079.1 zinc ribbon domain-containing protein [Agromyces sp. LY-1358]
MPTYSYRCTECDNAFDIHQAFTDDALTTCEVCGGRLRKLFNTIGVTFNGSGFYRTDSRAGGDKGGADASSGGSSTSGGSSESKPAASSSTAGSSSSSSSSSSSGSSSSS